MEELLPSTFPLITRISRVVRCHGYCVEINEKKLIVGHYNCNNEYKRLAIIQITEKEDSVILYHSDHQTNGEGPHIGKIIFFIETDFIKEGLMVQKLPHPSEYFDHSYGEIHCPLKATPPLE